MITFLLSYLLLYTYIVLFAVVFLAAVALPLPTSTMMLAAGAFAGQGFLSLPVAFAVAMAANISGDLLGYCLARRYGERVVDLLRKKPTVYEHSLDRFIDRHPGAVVFLSRFAGTLDPAVNILAGWAGVPLAPFLWNDFLGNLVAIGGIMYLGYVVGANWLAIVDIVSTAGILIGIAVLLAGLVAVFGRHLGLARFFERVRDRAARIIFGDTL